MTDLHPNFEKTIAADEIIPPYNRVEVISEIKAAMMPPASWSDVFRIDGDAWFEPLEILWKETLEGHVKGVERRFVGAEFLLFELEDEEDDELRSLYLNIREWRDAARREFCAKVRRFTDLRYASRGEYSKHLPPPGGSSTPDQINEDSMRRGVSIFYRDIPPDDALTAFLHALFWSFSDDLSPAEQKLWDRLLYEANARICFRCMGLIGASKGEPTAFVCFELDATTPIVHAYPVSEAEARQINDGHIQAISDLKVWELR